MQLRHIKIQKLQTELVDADTLQLPRTQMRSALYDAIESFFGFGRADLLASFALFFDDPSRINSLDERFEAITPEIMRQTAREHLRSGNRTILVAQPGAAEKKGGRRPRPHSACSLQPSCSPGCP